MEARTETGNKENTMTEEEQKAYDHLKEVYGEVYNTEELTEKFSVISFMAPYVDVIRKADNVEGTLAFNHRPRFYFNFVEG